MLDHEAQCVVTTDWYSTCTNWYIHKLVRVHQICRTFRKQTCLANLFQRRQPTGQTPTCYRYNDVHVLTSTTDVLTTDSHSGHETARKGQTQDINSGAI